MPESVLAPGALLTAWLLNYLAHSTVLIAGAWLLTRLHRVGPSARDVLWKTAIVGGFVTSLATVVAGRATGEVDFITRGTLAWAREAGTDAGAEIMRVEARLISDPTGTAVHVARSAVRPTGSAVYPAGGAVLSTESAALLTENAVLSGALRELLQAEWGTRPFRWYEGLMALWMIGALGGGAGIVYRRMSLRLVVSEMAEASPRARALLDEVGARIGRAMPELATSRQLDSPCVLPGGVIALSSRSEADLSDGELRAVLAHEVAHVVRHDVIWSAVLDGLVAVLWVQPLNRLARREARDAAELVCDDWALERTGERYGLASSISRIAEWTVGDGTFAAVVPMYRRSRRGPAERVRRILYGTEARSSPGWQRVALASLILVPVYALPSIPAPSRLHAALFFEQEERVFDVALVGSPEEPRMDSIVVRSLPATGGVQRGGRFFRALIPSD